MSVEIYGQNFKGIIPMKSTCQDVMKIFKEEDCSKKEREFVTSEEKIRIFYTSEKCQIVYGKKRNVQIGTVLIVKRDFIKKITLEELEIKLVESDYLIKDTDFVGRTSYLKKDGELEFYITDGFVDQIYYRPNSNNNFKLCKTRKKKK